MAAPVTFIDQVRREATKAQDAFGKLRALRKDWDALGGQGFINAHFLVNGEPRTDLDIVAADISAVFTTLDALDALLAQGHATNLAKVRI